MSESEWLRMREEGTNDPRVREIRKREFDRADTDKDGSITYAELETWTRKRARS